MIQLKLVDESSFSQVLALKLAKEDQHFVASNERSLAEARLYRENGDVFPHTIYADDRVGGFLLLEIDEDEGVYLIWRMMIDQTFQGKGYGRATVQAVINQARADKNCRQVRADYVKGNAKMQSLLNSLGFQIFGEDEREIWTRLLINA